MCIPLMNIMNERLYGYKKIHGAFFRNYFKHNFLVFYTGSDRKKIT